VKAANASHACALVLIDELARCGVRHACLSPGSRSAALAMALAEEARIEVHVCIDERSAAFMALGIARATGEPAIVLSTSGSATANFHPAIVEADASRVPMIVVTADRPPELRATGANQTIDQLKMYGDAVRWFCELGVPEERPDASSYWRSVADRAHAEALGGPAGPVHVNVPMREPLVPEGEGYPHDIEGRAGGEPWTRVSAPAPIADPADTEALAELVASTERGLVVAGDGPRVPQAAAFAERVGYPLLAEPLSNLRSGSVAISTDDALLRTGWAEDHRPDLVIRLGRVAVSKPLARFLHSDVRQALIDPDRWWLDPGRATSWILGAEPGALLGSIDVSRPSSAWNDAWIEAEGAARGALDRYLDSLDDLNEPRLARDLVAELPSGSDLVAASSMPIRDLDSFMDKREGVTLFGNRGASGIDGFVSTALGIASGREAATFALAGDLSMLHDGNGLLDGRRRSVDCTFVVLNNDGGGIFSFLPQANFPDNFERLFGTPHGVDFERVAALHDLGYTRIERAVELPNALAGGGVRIVEARTDRERNVEVHRGAWAAVADALS
jgi:2-succinyl-5-enolpyruvyl-6-hydroxy-3-cyclohexene-1-carboxylate synthase